MKRNTSRFDELFQKYMHGGCSVEEKSEFLELVTREGYAPLLKQLISKEVDLHVADHTMNPSTAHEIFEEIVKTASKGEPAQIYPIKSKPRLRWWAAAVLVVLLLLSSFHFFYPHPRQILARSNKPQPRTGPADVAPGHAGAILTLANGKKIVLDSLQDGLLSTQGNVDIVKSGDHISYLGGSDRQVSYNTMTTPNGRQFQLELSDGTRVWLDAGSSITYPTAFSGRERKVDVTGEAYFEVRTVYVNGASGEKKLPFTVVINPSSPLRREIQVLGTHFNVNAYDNERAAKITLLQGRVRVLDDLASVTIKPGQQAVMDNKANRLSVVDADVNQAVAWKDGYFSFKDASIEVIMRQVERWYDVQVIYEGKKPAERYGGEVSKNVNASEMLKILEAGGINFKIEGRKIIVRSQ